jgi:Uma2 family endonuclease
MSSATEKTAATLDDLRGVEGKAELIAGRIVAGTRVVWEVDPRARCVHVYRADAPDQPVTFHQGQVADAEPAVPGWRMAADDIFA